MPVDLIELLTDLRAESDDLEGMLTPLAPGDWDLPTPAAGWAVRDQVSHLAYFDESAVLAVTDDGRFRTRRNEEAARGPKFIDSVSRQHHGGSGGLPPGRASTAPKRLLSWFRYTRGELILAFGPLDPARRIPWYGPDMSVASAVTARLMETWAHGQDVADALGVVREPTGRLRHVAHLGVRARAFSFEVHGLPAPAAGVRVELEPPGGGQPWTWGSAEAENTVVGTALDFCLVVTQRRHMSRTGIKTTGPVATAWMECAQAFAGPPTTSTPER